MGRNLMKSEIRKLRAEILLVLVLVLVLVFSLVPTARTETPIKDLTITGNSQIKSGTFSIQTGVIFQALAGSTVRLEAATVTVGTLSTQSNANLVLDPNGTGSNQLLAKTYVGDTTFVTPSAIMHLAAGAAAAGSAPVKLTLGPLLTAPEAGAIEFDGPEVYATTSTPTRKRLATEAAPVAIAASDINWNLGSTFTKTLAANTTFTFSNAVDGRTIVVAVTNTASNFTVAWTGVIWSGGTVPTQTGGAKTDVYTFVKVGAAIYGSAVQNF